MARPRRFSTSTTRALDLGTSGATDHWQEPGVPLGEFIPGAFQPDAFQINSFQVKESGSSSGTASDREWLTPDSYAEEREFGGSAQTRSRRL